MLFIKPLSQVGQHELSAVGYRGQDLALLSQEQVATASSFVLLATAFDETVRVNNLKYKIDYILGHAQLLVQQSFTNAYNGVRKALLEAKLPHGMETELRETYERVSAAVGVGELVAQNDRVHVRVIVSMNRIDDPESNDTIIQNVTNVDELLLAVREAWALAYAPTLLHARMKEHYQESKLKIALIIQAMDGTTACAHAYSCLPQDHSKLYLQAYEGELDVRERVKKDYYAISKESLKIVAREVRQTQRLQLDGTKQLAVVDAAHSELLERDLLEVARVTRKIERSLRTPVKAFFALQGGDNIPELLWVNRLGFDILFKDDAESAAQLKDAPEPSAQDFLLPDEPAELPVAAATPKIDVTTGVAAKLLRASLSLVRQTVERKFRGQFGESTTLENLAEMVERLNGVNVFSRRVDGPLLLQAEEAARNEGQLSQSEYAKTIEEVAFVLSYA
jgi:phosphoenolpyruvate synthase/pyruvate phosphate dikinase